jgi:hypothetical protein
MEIEMKPSTDEPIYEHVDIYEEKSVKAGIGLCNINHIEGFIYQNRCGSGKC